MGVIAITGSASGIGAATAKRLIGDGHRVIGVDRPGTDADVVADLASADGRQAAIDGIARECGGVLDGAVTCAGVGGLPGRDGGLLVSVNYFGTVTLLDGLRPLLAEGRNPAAVAISSNSTTTQPGVPMDVVEACLAGDEAAAVAAGDAAGAIGVYPATKIAVARWIRHQAVRKKWAGAGITLNAIAPGATETAMVAELRADPTIGRFIDDFPIPVGRFARPEDIAGVIAFLLGPDARFLCGSVVFADGGTDAGARPDDWPAPR